MANGADHRASFPCDNEKAPGNKPEKVPKNSFLKAKHKRGVLFSSYASAQDLRNLDLENEKEHPSSPRGVLESCKRGLDSDPASPKNSATKSVTRCTNSTALTHWSKIFKLWKGKSIKRLASFPPLGVPKLPKWKSRSTRENPELSNIYKFKSSLVNFSLSHLETATNNFRDENVIGRGGYAKVYKGRLKDGQLIAVKRLTKGTTDERTAGFLSELGIIAHVDHPNTAKLIGVGVEGGLHLVFQLSQLGSLGSVLHGLDNNKLDWSRRYKIALGIADGLLYLHESCHRRIIHRDIKSDNILLTEGFEPQVILVPNRDRLLDYQHIPTRSSNIALSYSSEILVFFSRNITYAKPGLEICDFGLAKWLPDQWSHHSVSKFEGTFGYFAPEYFMHGIVDEKTDVYSFGILLLELISGRQALDHLQQSVVIWAKPLLNDNNIKQLVDPSLANNYDPDEMDRVVLTASLCIEQSPILRPRMSQVVILLRGDDYVRELEKECQRQTYQRTYSEELLDALEYNSTKFLCDINQRN